MQRRQCPSKLNKQTTVHDDGDGAGDDVADEDDDVNDN